jgi:hypothetical protein
MAELTKELKRFPALPDEAIVNSKVAAALSSLSERTIRYDLRLPRIYLNNNRYGYRAGDVRKLLQAGGAS